MADKFSDDALDKLLADLPSGKENKAEEKPIIKKKDESPFKDKKNDESNTYEYSDDKDLSDEDW